MSQAGMINTSSGPVPPTVATSYVTDVNSPAVPAANVLDVFGGSSTSDTDDGIQTDGSSGGNVLTVQLTNRITGTGTTTDGITPVVLYTFPLGATPGTYLFTTHCVSYNVTDATSDASSSFRAVRTTGAAGTLISAASSFLAEESPFNTNSAVNDISGNNATFTVIGTTGKTINWRVLTTYEFVS